MPDERGFTLFELLIVLAIMGLLTALVSGRLGQGNQRLDLESISGEIGGALREARSVAILKRRPTEVVFDLDQRDWRGVDGVIHAVPQAVSIQIVSAAEASDKLKRGLFRFEPDGSSSGGSVALALGARRTTLAVNWLTGRVTQDDAH